VPVAGGSQEERSAGGVAPSIASGIGAVEGRPTLLTCAKRGRRPGVIAPNSGSVPQKAGAFRDIKTPALDPIERGHANHAAGPHPLAPGGAGGGGEKENTAAVVPCSLPPGGRRETRS